MFHPSKPKVSSPEPIEDLLAIVKGLDGLSFHVKANVLSGGGDDRLAWDPRDLNQLKEARDRFYELIDKGYLAFVVDQDTGVANKNKRIIEFEPNAGELVFSFRDVLAGAKEGKKCVMHPPVAGG